MRKMRWVMSYGLCSKFHTFFFQQCKNVENRLRFDEVSDSLKAGTFLRHCVVCRYTQYIRLYMTVRVRRLYVKRIE